MSTESERKYQEQLAAERFANHKKTRELQHKLVRTRGMEAAESPEWAVADDHRKWA